MLLLLLLLEEEDPLLDDVSEEVESGLLGSDDVDEEIGTKREVFERQITSLWGRLKQSRFTYSELSSIMFSCVMETSFPLWPKN